MQDVTNAAQTQQWSFVLQQLVQWVVAGFTWIIPIQARIFAFVLQGESFWSLAATSVLLFLPAMAVIGGLWMTMAALYTIPFRLGRSVTLLQSVALAWWDVLRMSWFYSAGFVGFLVVCVGWLFGLFKVSLQRLVGTINGAI